MAKHPLGTELRCCHDGKDYRAQVTAVDPDTGDVTGLAVINRDGAIVCGLANPTPAATLQEHILDGHFWEP